MHARWIAFLQRSSFTIEHKSGALNWVVDAFSERIALLTTLTMEISVLKHLKIYTLEMVILRTLGVDA